MDDDQHMVVDMDLHSYLTVEMIEDVPNTTNMVDIDVATNVELDVTNVVEDLHDTTDLYVPDFPMVDLVEDLHVSLFVNLSLHVDIDFMFEDVIMYGFDQLQRLLVKHSICSWE